MVQGGYRPGAGRKRGSKAPHTLEAELARVFIAQRVGARLGPIVDALVSKATEGDVRAAQVLLERAYGRVADAPAVRVTDMSGIRIVIRPPVPHRIGIPQELSKES